LPGSVILGGARTPIGRLLGALSLLTATELGAAAIVAALTRAGITGEQVDAVVMGNVVQAGAGPSPARLAAVAARIPMRVPATTVNKLCLSGLTAVAQADQLISLGHSVIVVAGGMESMTGAPAPCPLGPPRPAVRRRPARRRARPGCPGVRARRGPDGRRDRALPGRPGHLAGRAGRVRRAFSCPGRCPRPDRAASQPRSRR
jgi:acetyl-CoA acetyltransferase